MLFYKSDEESFLVSAELSFMLLVLVLVLEPVPLPWLEPNLPGPPTNILLDNALLRLLSVLVMPLVCLRDKTGLKGDGSSRSGIISKVRFSQVDQSGIFLSWIYLSLVTDLSARISNEPNMAPGTKAWLIGI